MSGGVPARGAARWSRLGEPQRGLRRGRFRPRPGDRCLAGVAPGPTDGESLWSAVRMVCRRGRTFSPSRQLRPTGAVGSVPPFINVLWEVTTPTGASKQSCVNRADQLHAKTMGALFLFDRPAGIVRNRRKRLPSEGQKEGGVRRSPAFISIQREGMPWLSRGLNE